MNSIFRFYWILILAFFCSYGMAQNDQRDDLLPDTLRYLDELVVTAERHKEFIPSQRLSGEELQRLSSHSVADALRYFSGIQVKDYGGVGGLKTVDIRSMGSNHLGVFYDGIQLGNAQNGQVDLGKFSLENVEEISLYNGQKTEVLQSAREFGSAGTIYLQTRIPRFPNGKKTNVTALFKTGSFDLINPTVLWEQKLSPTVNTSFNVGFVDSSGEYKFRRKANFQDGSLAWDTTAVRHNGDIRSIRFEGGVNGYLDRGKWQVKAYYYNSERGIPGAIVNKDDWQDPQRQWDENAFVQASLQKGIGDRYEFRLNTKYTHDWLRYADPRLPVPVDNRFTQREFYVSVANKYRIASGWDVSLSLDHQWNDLDANLNDFVFPSRNTTWLAFATALQWNRLKLQASALGTFVRDKREVQAISDTRNLEENKWTPAVFLSYTPFAKEKGLSPLQIHAFYKRIFRMPTFNELYYTYIGSNLLNPEYVTQYDIGFQYKKKLKGIVREFSFKADLYYNEVDDKILSVFKGSSLFGWQVKNYDVKIKGVDLNASLSGQIQNDWFFRGSLVYTFQKAQDYTDSDDTKDGGTYKGQIPYIPEHSGSLIGSIMYKTWDMNYSFIYVGKRYHSSANTARNLEQPWYTHDLSLGKQFRWEKANVKLSLEVNNLLNQYYDVILNYPMPGRNYKLIIRLDI